MASAMDSVTQNQIAAAQKTGETVTAAQGIVGNARALQEMTDHILDKFDVYMSGISQVRERDENYEKRTAELLNRMQQENKDLAALIESLAAKIGVLTAESGESSLKEIHGVLSSMESSVGKISATLSAIAEED